jgi:excisionase family DNA binding protein
VYGIASKLMKELYSKQTMRRVFQMKEVINDKIQSNQKNTLTFHECWDEIFERTISKDKLYALVRAGSIPHVKIGAKILFRRDAMVAWFQQEEEKNLSK